MSEEVIVRLGAPTLAGIKTGSLFTCAYTSRKSVEESLRQLNRCFAPKGLCLLPLRYSEKNVLLYLFRPAELSRDLQNSEAAELLRQEGYPCESCGKCLAALTRKLRSGEEFPHEIGLFLSYPPEDVKGLSKIAPPTTSSAACGRSTATRRKRKSFLPNIKNARTSIANGTKPAAVSPSSPSQCDAPERKILL